VAGKRVGVDVQQPSVPCEADAGQHRHDAGGEQRLHHVHVGVAGRKAHRAEADDAAIDREVGWCDVRQSARTISAGQPDGADAGRGQCGHEACVDESRQDRDHDRQSRLVGDAQSLDLPLLDARHLQRRVDFPAAAMDNRQRC